MEPSSNEADVSAFLQSNFAPLRSEDDFDLVIKGEIPREMRGALFRNGPNPQFQPCDPNHHWFNGDGMIHGFYFEGGRVSYRNRYVRTPKWRLEHAAGRSLFGSFGNPQVTDPSARGKDSGSANTNIVHHNGRLLALEEGHMPTEMDVPTLATVGYVEAYRGNVTAHPKLDSNSGEMVWFAYNVGEAPFSPGMSYGITGPDGSVFRRDDLQAPYASMIHDFMVTERHVMIPVLPVAGSLERVMKGGPAYSWEPGKGSHVAVMRRDGSGTIRWFNTDACYVFHFLNAWEEGDILFADVMRYAWAPLFPDAAGAPGRPVAPRLFRWTMDLRASSDAIKETPLDDLPGEFPRIDPRYETRKHRHGWYLGDSRDTGSGEHDMIAHLDLSTGVRQCYELKGGDIAGEPVFTPRSPKSAEGDGWITSVIWRAAENRSDLAVFDAQGIDRGPIALAELPRRVPFGFHGNWVDLP